AASGNSRNETLVFTDQEKIYKVKTYRLPTSRRDSRGERLAGILDLSDDEVVNEILNVEGEELRNDGFCLIGTKGGFLVKNPMENFSSAHISGIRSLKTEKGDSISSADLSHGGGEIIMASREGQVIRFSEEEARTTQRPSKGVKGMSLDPGDQVVSVESVSPKSIERDPMLLFVTETGKGKKVPLSEFSSQQRSGKGNLGIKLEEDDGLREVKLLERGEEVMLYSEGGQAIRLSIDDISQFQRYARGVKLMELGEFDLISSVTVI
ncbi:MAG: DNA gyrase C-terminal beta-propeller domain-containing protein, partial [Candidatus Bipolaricaulota bacterium]